MRCHGVPLVTISRGRLVCENGVFMCAEGSGKFYPQRTFPDYLYKKMVQREKVHLHVYFCPHFTYYKDCIRLPYIAVFAQDDKSKLVKAGNQDSCCAVLCQLTASLLQTHQSNCLTPLM